MVVTLACHSENRSATVSSPTLDAGSTATTPKPITEDDVVDALNHQSIAPCGDGGGADAVWVLQTTSNGSLKVLDGSCVSSGYDVACLKDLIARTRIAPAPENTAVYVVLTPRTRADGGMTMTTPTFMTQAQMKLAKVRVLMHDCKAP